MTDHTVSTYKYLWIRLSGSQFVIRKMKSASKLLILLILLLIFAVVFFAM